MDFCSHLDFDLQLHSMPFLVGVGIRINLAVWGKVRCVPSNSFVDFVRGCYKFCEHLVECMSEGILDLESSQWQFWI